jgi:hypothetical protein
MKITPTASEMGSAQYQKATDQTPILMNKKEPEEGGVP